MSALSRFAGDVLAPKLFSEASSDAPYPFSLSARLALPGRDIQGNAMHENLYTAIDQLVAKLTRLSRKRKTRLAKKFKRARRPPAVHSKGQSPTLDLFAPLKSKSQQAPQYWPLNENRLEQPDLGAREEAVQKCGYSCSADKCRYS